MNNFHSGVSGSKLDPLVPANRKKQIESHLSLLYLSVRNGSIYELKSPFWNRQPSIIRTGETHGTCIRQTARERVHSFHSQMEYLKFSSTTTLKFTGHKHSALCRFEPYAYVLVWYAPATHGTASTLRHRIVMIHIPVRDCRVLTFKTSNSKRYSCQWHIQTRIYGHYIVCNKKKKFPSKIYVSNVNFCGHRGGANAPIAPLSNTPSCRGQENHRIEYQYCNRTRYTVPQATRPRRRVCVRDVYSRQPSTDRSLESSRRKAPRPPIQVFVYVSM